jgi:pimeloyl-ACP methyl ester carboxylesterase
LDKRQTEFERLRDSADTFEIEVDGLTLPLKRYRGKGGGGPPVLLLHGGSTCSDIFLVPGGGLVQYLLNRNWEVWTLDWRGSCRVVDALPAQCIGSSSEAERALFTLDAVATRDIPRALQKMREHVDADQKIGVVGFCAGSGALSMAIARGQLRGLGVDNVVLMTLGLFYETPWDGWVKAEDFLIERVIAQDATRRGVSPHGTPWAGHMEDAYSRWPRAWLTPGASATQKMYRRLTFMFGEPYASTLEPDVPPSVLLGMFGSLHLGLYLHLGQQVRRGFAAKFDAPDILDRSRVLSRSTWAHDHDLEPQHFYEGSVALIGGAQNRLWHRDSVDLMYEWLRSNAPTGARKSPIRKHIFPGYAHLDLLWGPRAREDVYPIIKDSLDPARSSDGLLKRSEARAGAARA